MLVIAAPGQGAQTPGFLAPWLRDPALADRLAAYVEVTGLDLVHYGTEADADTIRDTAIAQPLLVASALLAGRALEGVVGTLPAFALAGHSVGELAAAGLSGTLSDEEAMVLVRERGRAMAEASAVTATGMTAVLGGNREEVLAALARQGLTAANDNGAGQIVAAGTTEQLAALAGDPPVRARIVPLSVAGAFHTTHMAPAVGHLEALAATITPRDPHPPVLSNRDGALVTDGEEVLARLVGQIANPVRWDLCMQHMLEAGVTGLLELPPAGTLTGIARRAMKGVATFALKTPDQLDDAVAFVRAHGGSASEKGEG